MRRMCSLVVLSLVFCAPIASAEPAECTTTVVIKTCGDLPVEEKKFKLTTIDGERFKGRTDGDGQCQCPICHDAIADVQVSGANHDKISRTTVSEESNGEVRSAVILNICNA